MKRRSTPAQVVDFAAIRRLLVIKLRAVGDVVLSTVVLPNLRAAFPHAKLDFLAERSCRDVLEGNPNIDEVILFQRQGVNALRMLREMRRRRYDLVIDLFGNPRSALMTFASGAKYRVGFDFRGRSYAYNILVNPRGAEVHNVEFNLDALRRIQIPIESRSLLFPLSDEERTFAEHEVMRLGLNDSLVVGINPGTNRRTEQWPPEKFAELGRLASEKLSATILVFWGPGEKSLAEAIVREIGKRAHLAPPSSLKQLGALFTKCSIVVSNDSGPMHIAAALGVPTVGIFGPVNPRLQGPYGARTAYATKEGLDCLGCNYDTHCPIGNMCMTELEARIVFQKVEQLLDVPTLNHG
jgi:heptosyltransferase-3